MANLNVKTALTGGSINCVDRNTAGMKINGSLCWAFVSGIFLCYKFDGSSTATADGVNVIIPYGQSAGTAGRWILQPTKYLKDPNSATDYTFLTDGKGVVFSDGSKIFRSAGDGLYLIPFSDSYPMKVRDAANANTVLTLDRTHIQNGHKGAYCNLLITTTGASAVVTVTADYIVLRSSDGDYRTVAAVSLTPTLASSGANGLDAGSSAYSTWYYVFVIYNPATNTVAGLLSTSATAPTLPSGYTFFARVGAVYTQSTTNKYPLHIRQQGRIAQPVVAGSGNITSLPLMGSGIASFWTAISLAAFVPPTASRIMLVGYTPGSSKIAVAPNNSYSSTLSNGVPFAGDGGTGQPIHVNGSIMIEGSNIYWGGDASGNKLWFFGYEDNL
jgi:hypothetical protein